MKRKTPESVRIIKVFVSSPGDVSEERTALNEALAAINKTDGQREGFRLETFQWKENVVPKIGSTPQCEIDLQTPPYDIYLGIMSARFGTVTGEYGSGTEKEFRDALGNWKADGKPLVTFYFNDLASPGSKPEDVKQYLKVCEFRQELGALGVVGIYSGVRGSVEGFYEQISEHMQKIAREVINKPKKPNSPRKSKSTGPSNSPKVPSNYKKWLLARCGEIELMGLEIKSGAGVWLNHIYTPLITSARTEETQRTNAKLDASLLNEDRESIQLLLELLDKQSLYVSGDPGSGKTTFCRWVTWLVCNGLLPSLDVPAKEEYCETFPESLRDMLPVFVRLRDLWQHFPDDGHSMGVGGLEEALKSWLAKQKFPGLSWTLLKSHLKHGSTLLMLDGVDEVPPVRTSDNGDWSPRAVFLAALAEAAPLWAKAGNRLLLTSRPYGMENGQERHLNLPHAPIVGLDRTLQALLVHRWFVRIKESQDLGKETANALTEHLHVERGPDELAVNPLLLTAMCIIYDEGKRLPRDKYVLYDRIVDTVLYKRYSARQQVGPIRGRLAAIALGMHTGKGLGQIREAPEAKASEPEVDLLLQAYRQVDGSTDKGLTAMVHAREDLLSQSGLLISRGDGEAGFFHLSIQEFLAAERLFLLSAREKDGFIDLMTLRGPSAGWRNTLSFLFGGLIHKFSPHLGIEWLQEVIGRLALPAPARAGVVREAPFWNLAILLFDCYRILMGREAVIPEKLQEFLERCSMRAIEQEIPLKQRHTLAIGLGYLGDPRIAPNLRIVSKIEEHPGYVRIPAGIYPLTYKKKPTKVPGPFWLTRFPVTNSQYEVFMEDHGYSRQELWSEEGWQWLQSKQIGEPESWRNPEFNAPNQPVVGVSFWEAEAFCCWAGGRLPMANEGEAAARGLAGSEYPWGDPWEDGICNSREAGLKQTSAVGIFPRSRSLEFELEDMSGNVFEWCQDIEEVPYRVFRGGCWWYFARRCRAAIRRRDVPECRNVSLGFRVAAVPSGGQQEGKKK